MLKFLRNSNVSSIIRSNKERQEIPLLKWNYCFKPKSIENLVNWLMTVEEDKPKVKMAKPNVPTLNYLRNYRDEDVTHQRAWKAPFISTAKFKRISPEFMELLGHNEQKSKTHIRRKLLPENPYTYTEKLLVDRKYKNTTYDINNNVKKNHLDLRRNPYQDMDPLELVDLLNYLLSGSSLTYTQSLRLINILRFFTEISPEQLANYLKIIHGQGVLTLESLNYLEKLLVEVLSGSDLKPTQVNLIWNAIQNAYNYDKPIEFRRPLKKLFGILENERNGIRKCMAVSKTPRNESRELSQSKTKGFDGQNDQGDPNSDMMAAYDYCTNKLPRTIMCPSREKLSEGVECNIPEKDGKYTLQKISITVSYGSAERQNRCSVPIQENPYQTAYTSDVEQHTTAVCDKKLVPKTLAARAKRAADIYLGRKPDKSIVSRDLKPTFAVKQFTTLRQQKSYRAEKCDEVDNTNSSIESSNDSWTTNETSYLDNQVQRLDPSNKYDIFHKRDNEYNLLNKQHHKRGITYDHNYKTHNESKTSDNQADKWGKQNTVRAPQGHAPHRQYHKVHELYTSFHGQNNIPDQEANKSDLQMSHVRQKHPSEYRQDVKTDQLYTSPYNQTHIADQRAGKSQKPQTSDAPDAYNLAHRRDHKPGEQYTSPYSQNSLADQDAGKMRKPQTAGAPERYSSHRRDDKPGEHYTSPYNQTSLAAQDAGETQKPQKFRAAEEYESTHRQNYKPGEEYTSPYSQSSQVDHNVGKSRKPKTIRKTHMRDPKGGNDQNTSPFRKIETKRLDPGELVNRGEADDRSSFSQIDTASDGNNSTQRRDGKNKTNEQSATPNQETGKIFKPTLPPSLDRKVDKQSTSPNQDIGKIFKESHKSERASRQKLHPKAAEKYIDQSLKIAHDERISPLTDVTSSNETGKKVKIQKDNLPKKERSRQKNEMQKLHVFRTDVNTEQTNGRRPSPAADLRLTFKEQFQKSPFRTESRQKIVKPPIPSIQSDEKVIVASPKTVITLPAQKIDVDSAKVTAAQSNTETTLRNLQKESTTVQSDRNVNAAPPPSRIVPKQKHHKRSTSQSDQKVIQVPSRTEFRRSSPRKIVRQDVKKIETDEQATGSSKSQSTVSKHKEKVNHHKASIAKRVPIVPVYYKEIQSALSELPGNPGKFVASTTELQTTQTRENLGKSQTANENVRPVEKLLRISTSKEKPHSIIIPKRSIKQGQTVFKSRRRTILLAERYMQKKREIDRKKEREREQKRKTVKKDNERKSRKLTLEEPVIMEEPVIQTTTEDILPESRSSKSILKKVTPVKEKTLRNPTRRSGILEKVSDTASGYKLKGLKSVKVLPEKPVKKDGKVIHLSDILGSEFAMKKYTPINKISYDDLPEIKEIKTQESHKQFSLFNPIAQTEYFKENSEENITEPNEILEPLESHVRKKSILVNIRKPSTEKKPISVDKLLDPFVSDYSTNYNDTNSQTYIPNTKIDRGSIPENKMRRSSISKQYANFAAFKDTWSLNDSTSDMKVHIPTSTIEEKTSTSQRNTLNNKEDSEYEEGFPVTPTYTTVTRYSSPSETSPTIRRPTEPHIRLLEPITITGSRYNTAPTDSPNSTEPKAVSDIKTSTARENTPVGQGNSEPIVIVQTEPNKNTKGILDKRSNVRRESLQNESKRRLTQLATTKTQAIFDTNYRRASFSEQKKKTNKLAIEQTSILTKTPKEPQRSSQKNPSNHIFRTADNIINMNESTLSGGFIEPLYVGAISAHRLGVMHYNSGSRGPLSSGKTASGAAEVTRKFKKFRTKAKAAKRVDDKKGIAI